MYLERNFDVESFLHNNDTDGLYPIQIDTLRNIEPILREYANIQDYDKCLSITTDYYGSEVIRVIFSYNKWMNNYLILENDGNAVATFFTQNGGVPEGKVTIRCPCHHKDFMHFAKRFFEVSLTNKGGL